MERLGKILLLAALAAAPLAAQQSFVLPTLRFNPQNNNYPFAGPPMRYQQWFSAAEWRMRVANPARVVGVWFFAGPGRAGVGGRIVDLEVTMANSFTTTHTGSFDGNMLSGRTIVLPRTTLTLQAPTATNPVQIAFRNEFVWDGVSGVVLDIKLFDNGNSNQPYTYDLEYISFTQNRTNRLFTVNNPLATSASFIGNGEGMTVQFLYKEAISWPFGQGCAGEGSIVPVHTVLGGLPIPGNVGFRFGLERASSQRQATVFVGFSNTIWGSNALPFDLSNYGAAGCSLLVDPLASGNVMTVGGGAGSGLAQFPFPMPPTTNYVGIPFYSQWAVLDPAAPNGLLSMSNAMKHIPALQ